MRKRLKGSEKLKKDLKLSFESRSFRILRKQENFVLKHLYISAFFGEIMDNSVQGGYEQGGQPLDKDFALWADLRDCY